MGSGDMLRKEGGGDETINFALQNAGIVVIVVEGCSEGRASGGDGEGCGSPVGTRVSYGGAITGEEVGMCGRMGKWEGMNRRSGEVPDVVLGKLLAIIRWEKKRKVRYRNG